MVSCTGRPIEILKTYPSENFSHQDPRMEGKCECKQRNADMLYPTTFHAPRPPQRKGEIVCCERVTIGSVDKRESGKDAGRVLPMLAVKKESVHSK